MLRFLSGPCASSRSNRFWVALQSLLILLAGALGFAIAPFALFFGCGAVWEGFMTNESSRIFGIIPTLTFSIVNWFLRASSCMFGCLVNAFSPPDFGTYQIAYGYPYGFRTVGIEPFVNQLVQSFNIGFR